MRDAVKAEIAAGRGQSVSHITHKLKGSGELPVDENGSPVVASDSEIDTDIQELLVLSMIYGTQDGFKLVSEIA